MGIECISLHKTFGSPPTTIIKNVHLKIEDAEFVALLGKSGSGKSTLLYLLSSLDIPSSGTLMIDGVRIDFLSETELSTFRNEHIGFVFQFHYLLPEFTALENVLMPAMKQKEKEKIRDFAIQLLKNFGLGDRLHHYPSQLSGGQMQRVSIARALVMRPRYLFADEPTGALDSSNAKIVMDLFQKIHLQFKTTIILVTHDPDFAKKAKRQIHLVDGEIQT